MVFENDLLPEPTLAQQLWSHVPIAVLVLGVLGTFVAMHTAITGLLALALAHLAGGVVLMAIRRHRAGTASKEGR